MVRIEVSSNNDTEQKSVYDALMAFLKNRHIDVYAGSQTDMRGELWLDIGKGDLWNLQMYVQDP